MKVDIDIQNFGKIRNAHIKVRPFTVIAGVNSSGKSFISRALYSFFNTVNLDHFYIETNRLVDEVYNAVKFTAFELERSKPTSNLVQAHKQLTMMHDKIRSILTSYTGDGYMERNYVSRHITVYASQLAHLTDSLLAETNDIKKYDEFKSSLEYLKFKTNNLFRSLSRLAPTSADDLGLQIKDALIDNFQVRSLRELKNSSFTSSTTSFKISNLGTINFTDDVVHCDISPEGLNQYRDLKNVAFIESPMYWKLKPVLESRRNRVRYNHFAKFNKNDVLTGVPQHFFDLVDLLEEKSKSTNMDLPIGCFSDINGQLGGELDITESGEIIFRDYETRSEYGLHSTATGIANIGIISLLIKNGVINRGSFLFIDEPESNLHPAWQGLMVDTLHKLSQCGVNVVVTTHSLDMIQNIENIIEESSNDNEHYAVNILNGQGESISDESPLYKKISIIKEQLGTPFLDSYMQNLW